MYGTCMNNLKHTAKRKNIEIDMCINTEVISLSTNRALDLNIVTKYFVCKYCEQKINHVNSAIMML